MRITFSIVVNVLFFIGLSAQNQVVLVDGTVIEASALNDTKGKLIVINDGVEKELAAADVLYFKKESGPTFTFLEKTGKKFKIKAKDIKSNYDDSDKARIFAYKYLRTKQDVTNLYQMDKTFKITEEQFVEDYYGMTKKIKSRGTTSIILGVVAFVLGVAVLMSSMQTASSLQASNLIQKLQPIKIEWKTNDYNYVSRILEKRNIA